MTLRHQLLSLAGAVVALNLLDALATLVHARELPEFYEGNPVMAPLLSTPWLFIGVKMSWILFWVWCPVRQGGKLGLGALWLGTVFYTGIAMYHLWIFWR